MLDCGDLIVLATPSRMPHLLPNLEAAARMKTGPDMVSIALDARDRAKRRTYCDSPEDSPTGGAFEMVKWGVLTRHRYPFQRTLTVLAARDELVVEAMVQFLLNEEATLKLAEALRCGESFPDHFQGLFRMNICKGHPYAREITVEESVVLSVNRTPPSLVMKIA
jgi:hypothetical protein